MDRRDLKVKLPRFEGSLTRSSGHEEMYADGREVHLVLSWSFAASSLLRYWIHRAAYCSGGEL